MKSPRSERPSTPLQSNIGCSHQHSQWGALWPFASSPSVRRLNVRETAPLWLCLVHTTQIVRIPSPIPGKENLNIVDICQHGVWEATANVNRDDKKFFVGQ